MDMNDVNSSDNGLAKMPTRPYLEQSGKVCVHIVGSELDIVKVTVFGYKTIESMGNSGEVQ